MVKLNEVIPTEDGGAEVVVGTIPVVDDEVNLVTAISRTTAQKYPSIHNEENMLDGEKLLVEMGQVVVDEYEIDKSSRSQWETNLAAMLKLFMNFTEKKNFPWPDASNVNVPFLIIAVLQFQARAYPEIIPPREVVKVFDPGGDDEERAERVTNYMNYQLLYEMDGFEAQFDKTLMQLPLEGGAFKKTYRDFVNKRNVSEYIPAMDLVMNYGAKSLEDAVRKTHVLWLTRNDIRRRVNAGVFIQDAWDLKPGDSKEKTEIQQASDDSEGVSETDDTLNKPRKILEQHRTWDLDGDGIEQPYIVTVDHETRKVLRIVDRRYTDTMDKEQVEEYFTDYTFFPNPEGGVYGLGFGTLLKGLNDSANTIINEIIDAGMLANMQGGFFLKKSGIKSADLQFTRGQFKGIDAWTDNIHNALFPLDFKGPNNTLFATLGLLFDYSKQVSSISETMTGQMPSSDTPATTVLALIEEGRKVFSTIHKRIHRSFKKESQKIYRLNSRYLDEEVYFRVLGKNNIPEGGREAIGREDFKDTYDIVPVSDPTITSRAEKIAKAQQVVQDVRSNPFTAQNEQANYIATKALYEILDVQDVDAILKSPMPDLSPEEENSNFIVGKPANVLPKQNHEFHIRSHQEFAQGSFAQQVPPEGQKLIGIHIQEHWQQLYLKQAKATQELEQFQQGEGASLEGDI